MELIATARFKKAMDRATKASAYTKKIAELVRDLSATAANVSHPLLEERDVGMPPGREADFHVAQAVLVVGDENDQHGKRL